MVEGAALLPCCVQPYLLNPRQAVWLTPTPAFQRRHYAQRPWIHEVLRTSSDAVQAFANWMARDEAYAAWVNAQVSAAGLHLIQVDVQQTSDELTAHVVAWFGLPVSTR